MAHLTIRVPEPHVAALRRELRRAFEERERSGASVEAGDLLDALEQLPAGAAGESDPTAAGEIQPAGTGEIELTGTGEIELTGTSEIEPAAAGEIQPAGTGDIELTAHPEVLSDAVHALLVAALAELAATVEEYWRGADAGAAVGEQVAAVASLAGLFRGVQDG